MKKILILGAGRVAKPLVRYLLKEEFKLTVISRRTEEIKKVIGDYPNAKAKRCNVKEEFEKVKKEIKKTDLCISLLPYGGELFDFIIKIARECIKTKTPMITTNYLTPQMSSLHKEAMENGVLILNEIGADPGIDHMEIMKLCDTIKQRGGKVLSISSCCGGLPLNEDTNPWGYKFSWSPEGVVRAITKEVRYLKENKEIRIKGEEVMKAGKVVTLEGLGEFEIYPNRDAIRYIKDYKVEGVHSIFRGTIRYPGWCSLWEVIVKVGWTDDSREFDLKGVTYKGLVSKLLGVPLSKVEKTLRTLTDLKTLYKLKWVGLLDEEEIGVAKGTAFFVLCKRLKERLSYKGGEKDIMIMFQEVVGEFSTHMEKIKTTLKIVTDEYKAVPKAVGLPAAIAGKKILENKITIKGVRIPVYRQIYLPILIELERLGIKFKIEKEMLEYELANR